MSETVQILRTSSLGITCYPSGPTGPDDFFQLMVERMVGVLANGLTGIIISPTAPGPNDRDKAWIPTTDGNVYKWWTVTDFTGWARPHPIAPSFNNPLPSDRRIWWTGSEADLITEDGGSPGVVGAAKGPFWERDPDWDGKFLLQAGTLQPSGDAVAIGDTGGADEVVLSEAQGGIGDHVHPIGVADLATDDAFIATGGTSTVPTYTGHFITGSGTAHNDPETTANLFTLKAGIDGAGGGTPDPTPTIPPYKVGFLARRTARYLILPP